MQNSSGINVRHTARFLKSFKRLPKNLQEKVTARDLLFRKNPSDTRLGTHKLHGQFQGYWAYSVDYHYRVIFIFEDQHTVTYHDVGPHPIYGGE